MYTSEIREVNHEGKPVAVSPALLERVRRTDDMLRERLDTGFEFNYSGRWVFPTPDKAMLSFQVKLPDEPDSYVVSLNYDETTSESFAGRAVDAVLVQAQKASRARLDRRIRDLLVSTSGD